MNKGIKVLFLLFSLLFLLACFCDGSGGTVVQSTPDTPKEHKAVHPPGSDPTETAVPVLAPAPPPEPVTPKVETIPNVPAINLPVFTFDPTATLVPGSNKNPPGNPGNPLIPPPPACIVNCTPR